VKEKVLAKRPKLALDELRMQTLGTQILFGFQLQSLFQPGFKRAGKSERIAARHRLAGAGDASRELLRLSDRCAELALGTIAIALGCIAFSLATHLVQFGRPGSADQSEDGVHC